MDTEKVDPRLRGDDEGWMAFAGMTSVGKFRWDDEGWEVSPG